MENFSHEPAATQPNRQAIVVVSFGSTFNETRTKDIGGIEAAIAAAFPHRAFKRAFTSRVIRARLAQNQDLQIDDLPTALTALKNAGYTDVLVQPTHLLHGEEYEQKIVAAVQQQQADFSRLVLSTPLLTAPNDFAVAAAAVAAQFPTLAPKGGIVLMGHGSPRDNNQSFGNTYNLLQQCFDKMHLPVVVGTVETADTPNIEAVLQQVHSRGYQSVHLFPLMIVAGDHANNDMYSDEEDSWKSRIEKTGVRTIGHLQGIGRNAAIQAIYVQHALAAAAGIQN